MTKKDNQKYLIPMEVTKETIRDFNLDRSQIIRTKIGNKLVSAIMVLVTKEQYEAYMRPMWAELKREEREKRCVVCNGKGKLKRCIDNCKNCSKIKEGSALSLDRLTEENKIEFPSQNNAESEITLISMILEDLLEVLHQQDPELARIFKLLHDGAPQHAIGKLIGKKQTTINYKIKKMRSILQQYVDHDDIVK